LELVDLGVAGVRMTFLMLSTEGASVVLMLRLFSFFSAVSIDLLAPLLLPFLPSPIRLKNLTFLKLVLVMVANVFFPFDALLDSEMMDRDDSLLTDVALTLLLGVVLLTAVLLFEGSLTAAASPPQLLLDLFEFLARRILICLDFFCSRLFGLMMDTDFIVGAATALCSTE
jgi:hypothetical protein